MWKMSLPPELLLDGRCSMHYEVWYTTSKTILRGPECKFLQRFENASDTLVIDISSLRINSKVYFLVREVQDPDNSGNYYKKGIFSEPYAFKTLTKVDIFLKKTGAEYIQLQEGISSLEYTLQQLEPNTEYEVKISSKYDEENYDTYIFNTGNIPIQYKDVLVGEVFNSCYIKAQKIKENDVVNILSLQLQSSDKKYLYKKEEE